MESKFSTKKTFLKIQTGGSAPGAPVLDPPLFLLDTLAPAKKLQHFDLDKAVYKIVYTKERKWY